MPRGDRLEVEQRIAGSTVTYLHHGIDIGDGTVVHARPRDFRNPFGGGHVVRTSRADFAAGRPVRVGTDPPAAYSPDEIAARALAHVGRDGYHPVVDNCEHFATWCATGRRASRQVEMVMDRVAAGVARAAAAVSARTVVGTTVRLGLTTLVPAAIVGEAAALAAEWTAHQRGAAAAESRQAGEAAGLAASSLACAVAGAAVGPAGVVTGGLAGAALWLAGSVTAAAATGSARHVAKRLAQE